VRRLRGDGDRQDGEALEQQQYATALVVRTDLLGTPGGGSMPGGVGPTQLRKWIERRDHKEMGLEDLGTRFRSVSHHLRGSPKLGQLSLETHQVNELLENSGLLALVFLFLM